MTSLEEIKRQRSIQGLENSLADIETAEAEVRDAYAQLFGEVYIAFEEAHIPQTEIADLIGVTRVRVTQIMQDERKRRKAEARKAAADARKAKAKT